MIMNNKLELINEYVIETMQELHETETNDENLDNAVKKCIAMSTAGKTVISNFKLQLQAEDIKKIGMLKNE